MASKRKVYYIETHSTDPEYNLAFEEYVFNSLDKDADYFILWQNYNSIIVGKYQNTVEEINKEYVDANNIKVVRRLSGGGAVYHDLGNINFSIITNKEDNPNFDFALFVRPVIEMLDSLGIKVALSGRNDLLIDGKKFSGNSQYIRQGRILHHGTVMFNSDLSVVSDALNVHELKIKSKGIKSVKSRVTNISDYLENKIELKDFWNIFRLFVISHNDAEILELTSGQLEEIEKLRAGKYSTWDWNYGFSPQYEIRRDIKYDFGLVSTVMNVEKGYIKNIKFFGDFFGVLDINELEGFLIDKKLDESLFNALKGVDVDSYIHGMNSEMLFKQLIDL